MNFDRLRYIAERTEIGENKEAIFAVKLSEQAGAFWIFVAVYRGETSPNLTIA